MCRGSVSATGPAAFEDPRGACISCFLLHILPFVSFLLSPLPAFHLCPWLRCFFLDFLGSTCMFPSSSHCFLLGPLEGALLPGPRQAGCLGSHWGPGARMHPPPWPTHTRKPSFSPAAAVCFCQDWGKLALWVLPLSTRPWELLQPGSPKLAHPWALPCHPSWAQSVRHGEHGGAGGCGFHCQLQ